MRTTIAATALASLLLSACSNSTFNDADVLFATEAIRHDQQAIAATALVSGRSQSEEVQAFATLIEDGARPELLVMSGWLASWSKPVPTVESALAEADGTADDLGAIGFSDLDRLKKLSGRKFDREFVDIMIRHHRGAVTTAKNAIGNGADAAAKEMARSIVDEQEVFLADLLDLRDRLSRAD